MATKKKEAIAYTFYTAAAGGSNSSGVFALTLY